MTTRVLLVDDHPVVRRGVRATIEVDETITVAGEAGSGEQALALLAEVELAVDVVLLDLQLGAGIDGAETTRRIQRLPRPPRVLVLTTYDTDADILPAIEAGATGYLLKDTDPAELIAAIHAAAAGDTVLAPSVATRLVSRVRAPGIMLTPRETQVLQMVADGLSNQGIAKELFITEATVKSHLVQVFTKLGVDSRTAATAAARQRGLIR
ncbi:response regulator [Nakamurella multipartita]|jgi:DNA-binding NarL/FixJ family response regulator|uniref:Two component transcriptional regulator, LuxR family n=1 Tax=Nakamurella multipartita (strain ATCC 700099 / DSM 44233 / CIP 104796 / JCM 9543 / NBRC 105858 / Y-104) TaxID=479431 RepID=C8XFG7_NAKMY|nr:response regulator transcription factor [Nakamurella multipartita]ACV79944.1 two component transcriptional regulator, LuxR family [Nakamurella multipartita DSM 44233]HET9647804.1 response regulator transcription factor [Microlunatus sp.]